MFLSHIRSNPHLVKEIFGDEQETTRQSSLAAQYWREMTDEGRRVRHVRLSVHMGYVLMVFAALLGPGREGQVGVRGRASSLRGGDHDPGYEHQLQHPSAEPDVWCAPHRVGE